MHFRVGGLWPVFVVAAIASCDVDPDGVCPDHAAPMDDVIAAEAQEVGALRTELLQMRGGKETEKTPCPDCSGGLCGCAWATATKCSQQPPKNPTCCRSCCCDEVEKKESKPVPPPKPVDPMDLFSCEKQVDYTGADLKKMEGLSQAKCAKACVDDAKCHVFVHDEGTTCWLKEGKDLDKDTWWLGKNFGVKRTGCIEKADPLAFFDCLEHTDLPQNDLVKVTGVTDLKDCAKTCKDNGESSAFVYDDDDTCWLKKKGVELHQSSWWLGKAFSDRTSCLKK